MASKKITELVQVNAVDDSDLFIVETNNGTRAVPYSEIKGSGGSDSDISFNGTGIDSIAIGTNTNASQTNSIAIGHSSNAAYHAVAIGKSTKSGNMSVAIGCSSSANGASTISIGNGAKSNKEYSTAIGCSSSANGNNSVAIGCYSNASLDNSTALGSYARAFGTSSIAIGCYSNVNMMSINSIAIGVDTRVNANYSVSIGYNAQTTNANSIQLGDATNLSSITAKVSITTTSDERDKADITEIEDNALEFLNKVKTIRYVFNGRKLYIDNDNLSDEEKEKLNTYGMCEYDREAHEQGTKKGNRIRVGVSAQNIQQALIDVFGDSSYANLVNDNLFDYNPDEIPEGVESQLAVNYEGFIPFLIKAVQELDSRVKALENK